MKQYSIAILLLLFLTSFSFSTPASPSIAEISSHGEETMTFSYRFSHPDITETSDFLSLHCQEANSYLSIPGAPLLPSYFVTTEFPLGTKITTISITVMEETDLPLSKKITPSSTPLPSAAASDKDVLTKNQDIYQKNELYPEEVLSYTTHGGLNRKNDHVTFLALQIYPFRYNPSQNILKCISHVDVSITYQEAPSFQYSQEEEYDFLILTYDGYTRLLQPLATHKEEHDISTKIVTLSEIYTGSYFPVEGRDCAEQVKYFIKNAVEQWNTSYVMLVGNFRRFPVRYAHLETDKGGFYEELQFLSDLYFADIYDGEGNFSSWDSDGDGLYAEWLDEEPYEMEDEVDLAPDVHLGRLACMFRFEVRTVVHKIIEYEESAHDSEWFNSMIVVGGDTFNKSYENGTDYNEGEVVTAEALEYMDGFQPVTLWTSLGNLTTANIQREISNGAGFLYFAGHGNPSDWSTHENGKYDEWTEGLKNRQMYRLSNAGKYPILMVGGCHNSEFDVSLFNLLKGPYMAWAYGIWTPECWSWVFVKKYGGGALASMGSTGYGGVNIGDFNHNDIPDCIEGADGWFETQFFRLYKQENIDVLGETYSQTVTDYVTTFPVLLNRYDAKIVETHVLFGDPTLRIGGYP